MQRRRIGVMCAAGDLAFWSTKDLASERINAATRLFSVRTKMLRSAIGQYH